jgi:DNA (cytosine-5)-methyltransferase 1
VQWLLSLLDLDSFALHLVEDEDFKKGWAAVSFLYPGLHPDEALEEGDVCLDIAFEDYPLFSKADPRLVKPFYKETGWPVVLVSVAREAWRRYENGDLKEEEFYCCEAQRRGMSFRNPELFTG